MSQPYQQLDPKAIEALKAARNQVISKPPSDRDPAHQSKHALGQSPNKFAEEFVQKLASIEQETAGVDEEMAKLEARRNELIKVKDKLKELDKEMSNVLKSQPV